MQSDLTFKLALKASYLESDYTFRFLAPNYRTEFFTTNLSAK